MECRRMLQLGLLSLSLLGAAVLLVGPAGCAPVQTRSTGGQAETAPVREGDKELREIANQKHLQGLVMAFADTFATKYGWATDVLIEESASRERFYVASLTFYSTASAFDIASGRDPVSGLVDMLILVTLNRIIWEEYWQPEVYVESGKVVVKTLKELEEDIWAIAARVLTPEQQKELRRLIHQWREKNPDQQEVSFIRLDSILELVGKDSVFQKETQPGGLFAPVREATQAVDEIRFAAERGMYMVSRMQLTLAWLLEMVFHQLATQQEVRQILSDISGFREIAERLPAQISEERRNIMRDLESQEKTIRNVVGDIREMMKEGNNLLSLVNETTKTVDSTAVRIDTIIRTPSAVRPFDIMDYQDTVLAVSQSLVQVKSLLDEFDELMVSPDWEKRMPVLLKLADGMQSEVIEESITHAFIYGAALMLIFFLCLFGYRYASRRFL